MEDMLFQILLRMKSQSSGIERHLPILFYLCLSISVQHVLQNIDSVQRLYQFDFQHTLDLSMTANMDTLR